MPPAPVPAAPAGPPEPPEPPEPPPPEPRRPRPPRRRREPPPPEPPLLEPPVPDVAPPSAKSLSGRDAGAPLPGRRAPFGGTGAATGGAGRESPMRGRLAAGPRSRGSVGGGDSGRPPAGGSPPPCVRGRGAARVSAEASAAPLAGGVLAGRSGEVSPGTRSAGPGRPVIESDIGKIPSRGRAIARRSHPAGGWRRAQRRSGAPAWGAFVSDEHSVPTVPAVAGGAAGGGVPVAQHDENGTDDERGSHERWLRRSRRCHPGRQPSAAGAPERALLTPRRPGRAGRASGSDA